MDGVAVGTKPLEPSCAVVDEGATRDPCFERRGSAKVDDPRIVETARSGGDEAGAVGERLGIQVLERDHRCEATAQLGTFASFESDGECLFECFEEPLPSLSLRRWANPDRARHITRISDFAAVDWASRSS